MEPLRFIQEMPSLNITLRMRTWVLLCNAAILSFFTVVYLDPMVCISHAKILCCCYLWCERVEFPHGDAIHSKWKKAVITKLQCVK